MNKTTLTLILSTILRCSAVAREVVDTKLHMSCAGSEFDADGKPYSAGSTEEINIEIKKINWNEKDSSKPPAWGSMTNIKIRSGDKTYEGALLRSTRDEVAFSFANDVIEKGNVKTLAFVYEVSLPKAELKRTMLTLFGTKSNAFSSTINKCKKN